MKLERVENQNLNQNALVLFDYYEEKTFFNYYIQKFYELIDFLKLKRITIHCLPINKNLKSKTQKNDILIENLKNELEKNLPVIIIPNLDEVKNHLDEKNKIGILNPSSFFEKNLYEFYENIIIDSYYFFLNLNKDIQNEIFKKNKFSISQNLFDSFNNLELLMNPTNRPKLAILGGTQTSNTIYFIEKNLKHFQIIFFGASVGMTALKANGIQIGNSAFHKEEINNIFQIMSKANFEECKVELPYDHIVADKISQKAKTKSSPKEITNQMIAIDIGPKTIGFFEDTIKHANFVFFHGPLGVIEIEKGSKGTLSILKFLQKIKKPSIISGYSLCEFAIQNSFKLKMIPEFEFISNYLNNRLKDFP